MNSSAQSAAEDTGLAAGTRTPSAPASLSLSQRLLIAGLGGPLLVAAAAVFVLLLPQSRELEPSLRLQLIAVTLGGMVLSALIMLWLIALFRSDIRRLDAEGSVRVERAEGALREALARYEHVVEGTQDGVFDWDFLRDQHYLSRRLKQMLGFSEDTLPSRREVFHELIHPDDRKRVADVVRRHFEQGETFSVEHRLQRADGRYLWVRARGGALRDDEGIVTRFCGVITDITNERTVNDRISALLEQQRALLDNAVAGIARLRSRRIVHCNRRFAEMLGYSVDELLDRDIELLHSDDAQFRQIAGLYQDLRTQWSVQHEVNLRRRDGTRGWYLVSGSALDPKNPVADSIWVLVDIDDRRRAETEVRAANLQLEERVNERTAELTHAVRDLEAFSYTVSHDLAAPLRAIEGFGEMLAEESAGRLDSVSRGHLERIQRAARNMRALLDDLLRLARVSRHECARERLDIAELARSIFEREAAQHRDREVRFVAPKSLPAQGDARLLEVAMTNLIGNAWKFSAQRDSARIEVGRQLDGNEEVFYVRDNGAGFDARYVDRLFKPFQRLHTAREFEGTGIGLAIVARVVEKHGGRAWAEGSPGKGATIYFTLPGHARETIAEAPAGPPAG